MNNDEFEQLRREINESVLAEDLEQHHELYADDINVPIEEAWSEPAMGRDMGGMTKETAEGFASGRFDPELAAAHGGDPGAYAAGVRRPAPAYGRDHDHMGMAYKADDGSKFPDLNKDGEVTQADILMGRGVIDEPASARDDMGDAHGRDMGMAYKGDHSMTWDEMTGGVPAYNRDPDDPNMWESKSATVRGWIIENFKPLRSDGYDPERIVSVLNERAEDELAPIMLQWFHENKRQLQKDGYDFDLVVDKLNED